MLPGVKSLVKDSEAVDFLLFFKRFLYLLEVVERSSMCSTGEEVVFVLLPLP